MSNLDNIYYKKYINYKNKYLRLKNMMGGNYDCDKSTYTCIKNKSGEYKDFKDCIVYCTGQHATDTIKKKQIVTLKFDLNPYKEFIMKLINNFDLEFDFTLAQLKGNIITEFYKGSSNMYDTSIFNKLPNFAYINCHTHFSSYKYLGTKPLFTPPSNEDYKFTMMTFIKYKNVLQLIFSEEGMYMLSVGQKLLDSMNGELKPSVDYIATTTKYGGYISDTLWDKFKNDIDELTISANNILSFKDTMKYNDGDSIKEIKIEDMISRYNKKYSVDMSKCLTLDGYLEFIRELGFNIRLVKWTDDFIFDFEIHNKDYKYIHKTMKDKINGTLFDSLPFHEELESEIHENMNESGFFILGNIDQNELYRRLEILDEGEILQL